MLPKETLKVLAGGFAHLGTVSTELKPIHIDALGASVDPEKNLITFFVRTKTSENFLSCLGGKTPTSAFVGLPTHEAYQFKGAFAGTRALSAMDLKISETLIAELSEFMFAMGMNAEKAKNYFGTSPDIGIMIDVEKIYLQTPGPDAGKELSFVR